MWEELEPTHPIHTWCVQYLLHFRSGFAPSDIRCTCFLYTHVPSVRQQQQPQPQYQPLFAAAEDLGWNPNWIFVCREHVDERLWFWHRFPGTQETFSILHNESVSLTQYQVTNDVVDTVPTVVMRIQSNLCAPTHPHTFCLCTDTPTSACEHVHPHNVSLWTVCCLHTAEHTHTAHQLYQHIDALYQAKLYCLK